MLNALSGESVEFLLVGGYALNSYGHPRSTGDIDFWIRSTPENAQRTWQALLRFRAPLAQLQLTDFSQPDLVYQIGVSPHRIDILTTIDGVTFDEAWNDKHMVRFDEIEVPTISAEHLLKNKLAVGRPRDLADADWLQRRQVRGFERRE